MKNEKHQKTLLIDIDGVACAHAFAICRWVNYEYGINSKYEDVKSWNHNFGPITFIQAVDKYYPRKEFILSMEVTPGLNIFLESMKGIINIKFATSRQYAHNETCEWIRNNLGEYETIFTDSKVSASFDYLIDDNHKECVNSAKDGRIAFMMSRPWNHSEEILNEVKPFQTIHVVKSFDEVEEYLDRWIDK